jgi:hypothetical protein
MGKLTKSRFMRLLRKAAQPLPEQQHDQEADQTSESRRSDDYSETRKSQDKTEGKED